MTDEQLIGNLFREALYSADSVPKLIENFSDKISANFTSEEFLLLQMATQLKESAEIRKKAPMYMQMMSSISSHCFSLINRTHPDLHFCTSQRFKSCLSELYKRYDRVQDGLSPEIRDLPALRIILLEDETQEILHTEYLIVQEILESTSALSKDPHFPLYVNLSIPDKSVNKNAFDAEKYPEVLLPNPDTIIPGLDKLGKDYISAPKEKGYQSYHLTFELVMKENPSIRIFGEIQIRTITQHKYAEYGPASHQDYKEQRDRKLEEIFKFDKTKVHLKGYYPDKNVKFEKDYSGFSKPILLTEMSQTF